MAMLERLQPIGGSSIQSPLLYGGLLATFVFFVQYLVSHLKNPLNAIPGPRVARWTNLRLKLAVITGRRMYYVHELHQKFGPFVQIAPHEISVADPEAFGQVHKIGAGFTKSSWYTDLTAFERPTLFTMTRPKEHGARRKLLARGFSKSYLRQVWEPLVHEKIRMVVGKMKDDSRWQGSTDALKWWTFMATDVSSHLMFGDSFHMIEKGQKDEYINVLESALKGGGIGAELPLVRAIGRYLPFEVCRNLFGANAYLVQKAAVAVTNAKAGGEKNLFAHIMREADKGEKLDDLDLKLEASGLIVAGSDTTAISLTYLVWAILSRPDLTKMLQEEVGMLPDDYADTDLEELSLLNAVIEETLRLYGAAPGGLPRAVPSDGVHLGGFFLPGGTTVTTQAYTMHRDPRIFPNPLKFDHTRWLQPNDSKMSKANPSSDPELAKAVFTPFGAGAQSCIGLHLARMELRLGAAEFFRNSVQPRLAPSTTPESMEMENFFLIAPKSHKCEVIC